MFEFSMPMPLSLELIDEIEEINKKLSKSRIISLYNNLPGNSPDLSGFEICRDFSPEAIKFEEFAKYIKYAQNKGFKFIYLLNLFRNYNADDIDICLDKTFSLIEKLLNIGVKDIRITSNELISIIQEKFPEINILASTVQEYMNINQYINFLESNNIKEVIPSWNQNKNFKFLSNLNSLFPNTEIELMLNEGCRYGCHLRLSHSIQSWIKQPNTTKKYELFNYRENCQNFSYNNFWLYLCKSRIIYPWDLEEYRKIKINKFKFVGRNSPQFKNGTYLKIYKTWLLGLDNPQLIDNINFRYFNHYLIGNGKLKFKVKDIKPFLPDIKHFVKYGHLCSSGCKKECNYCYKQAEKLKRNFGDIL